MHVSVWADGLIGLHLTRVTMVTYKEAVMFVETFLINTECMDYMYYIINVFPCDCIVWFFWCISNEYKVWCYFVQRLIYQEVCIYVSLY